MAKEAVISSIKDDLVPYDEVKVRELFAWCELALASKAFCATELAKSRTVVSRASVRELAR